MDDFLHNLRSGKLKQGDRGGRPYNDQQYKGSARRNMDRRKREFAEPKESTERLNAIKEVLETLSQTQERMAQAYEARTQAELRKARALEVLAQNIYRMLNPNANDIDQLFAPPTAEVPDPKSLAGDQTNVMIQEDQNEDSQFEDTETYDLMEAEVSEEDTDDSNEADDQDDAYADSQDERSGGKKLTREDRRAIVDLSFRMREEGSSWEKIARKIASQGYPTASGKGVWRGVMVKNLIEKMETP